MNKNIKLTLASSIILACQPFVSFSATGWLSGYLYTWQPGIGDTVYSLNTGGPASTLGTPAGTFQGANLGSFNSGYSLYLNAEINAWADGGDSYSKLSLLYRVYSGAPTGTFLEKTATSISPVGGNDFRGFANGADLSGLSAGSYTVEAYLSRSHTWSGGGPYTTYLNRTGDTGGAVPTSNLFSASFNVIPEPSSASLMALGAAGLIALRRRRTA